jgi:IMP dehydrogenase
MSRDLMVAEKGTLLEQAYQMMIKEKKKCLPLIDSEKHVIGMFIFSDVKRVISGDDSSYNVDSNDQLRVGAAIGVGPENVLRAQKLIAEHVDVIVIDTAHGDSKGVIDTLKDLKDKFPGTDVVVGNVSEPSSVERLIQAGADGIKVGQGPGSICTTRIIAGIGCPQVTSVYSCAKVAEKHNVPVCADGGLKHSGDIPIAIGAGANSVMMGSMFAGLRESPGEMVFFNGRQWKAYRGMGSLGAMEESASSRERYRQGKGDLVPEGVEGLVPYKGQLKNVIFQYIGGLKRGMGYVGAANIEELRQKANFHRISHAGQTESHPHDVEITKEAPNYSR